LDSEAYARGTVVFVPFPFTDLSGRKRRPALVVSLDGFHGEDLILCAITSKVPRTPSAWEVTIEAHDMADEELPKKSVIKAGKLFTMHRSLISGRYGSVNEHKLREVLGKLRELFAPVGGPAEPDSPDDEAEIRTEKVDEAVLALLHLNAFSDKYGWRAWKTFDWDAMDRLHEKSLISDPKSKAKSVVLTDEGRRAAEHAFRKRFAGP
jgi:mRNA-degrading endonuclease toxin of MazEF toxin-antitoxin module